MNKYCYVILLVVTLMGCKKIYEPANLDNFDIIPSSFEANIGDTIKFTLYGNADIVTFYSDQPGSSYKNKDRNEAAGKNILIFQTEMSQANKTNMGDTIRLLISGNLQSYDSAGVAAATWDDITDSATWPIISNLGNTNSTTSPYTYSGQVDISKYNIYDNVAIAFQVIGRKNNVTAQRRWRIKEFKLFNIQPDNLLTPLFFPPYTSSSNINSDTTSYFANVGWVHVNMKNNPKLRDTNLNNITYYGTWNVGEYGENAANASNTILLKATNKFFVPIVTNYPISFDPSPYKFARDNEDWLITSQINLKTVRPDFPTTILKNSSNVAGRNFKFLRSGNVLGVYSLFIDSTFQSGRSYQMVFKSQSLTVEKQFEKVKEINITVK